MERAVDLDIETLIDQAVAALPRGRRGNVSTPPTLLRPIAEDDLPMILASPAPPPAEQPIKRLRHTHHLAARCMAEGRSLVETSHITGYTPARLGQLKNDPTFQELMQHYKDLTDGQWLNVHERLAALGIAITEEIQQRLTRTPSPSRSKNSAAGPRLPSTAAASARARHRTSTSSPRRRPCT